MAQPAAQRNDVSIVVSRTHSSNELSYAKIRMKVKTFESRVFEMEYSSLKRRILTVSGRVIPGTVRALTNMSLFGAYLIFLALQSAQNSGSA